MINCTFFGNVHGGGGSPGGAPGVGHAVSATLGAAATLVNCIVRSPSSGVPGSLGGAVTATFSDIEGGYPGTGNIDVDPQFQFPALGNLLLQQGSPCVDAGDSVASAGVRRDILGFPRLIEGRVDMGAHEVSTCPAGTSDDDFVMRSLVNGVDGPGLCVELPESGDAITIEYDSINGDYVGLPAFLALGVYPYGAPPAVIPNASGIRIDPFASVVAHATPALPPGGVSLRRPPAIARGRPVRDAVPGVRGDPHRAERHLRHDVGARRRALEARPKSAPVATLGIVGLRSGARYGSASPDGLLSRG